MKSNQLFTSLIAVTAMFVASCSTPQLANNTAVHDDVYNTSAKAKEYIAQVPAQNVPDEDNVDDSYYGDRSNLYDNDYASRINRFYYGSRFHSYYDDYYSNSPVWSPYNNFYNPYVWGYFPNYAYSMFPRYSFNNFWNSWGYPYNNYWGYNSYYNYFPWYNGGYYGGYYGGGFLGGGFYGGGYFGNIGVTNPNYAPRPTRGVNAARPTSSYNGNASGLNPNNTAGRPTRPSAYNPSNNGSNAPSRNPSAAPGRSSENTRPSRPTESRPTYSPPPSSSSSGGSSSGGSSSGGGGGSRPTRGGGIG